MLNFLYVHSLLIVEGGDATSFRWILLSALGELAKVVLTEILLVLFSICTTCTPIGSAAVIFVGTYANKKFFNFT